MENELLKVRITETASLCNKTQKIKFLGFLSREEAVFAKQILKNINVEFSLYGGYENAERVILACFPDWAEDVSFPISAFTFTYRKNDVLNHRDFLGTLMGLGIKRETVGDILVEEGRAVVFVNNTVADYILSQISKVGRTGVTVTQGYNSPLPQSDELVECTDTIASERMDCIVAALAGLSRNSALQTITEGKVSVNSVICEKATKSVLDGDIISIRGKGRFEIVSLSDKTRKNRIILKYKKYV